MGSYIRKKDLEFIRSIKKCMYCGSSTDLTVDHIISKSDGGSGQLSNLTRCCQSCNSSKSDKTLHDWKHHLKNKLNHHLEQVHYCMDIIKSIESESYKIDDNG